VITVIVPAYNEEKSLAKAIDNIYEAQKEAGDILLDIVIVNDGSVDKTPEIISRIESESSIVRSIHHKSNKGLGVGVKEAIKLAKYSKFMLVSGDNDVCKEMIVNLFKNQDKADLIMGYYLNKEDRGRARNLISSLFGLTYMCCFNIFIQYLNGPTVYSTSLVRQLNLKSNRFSICAELTIKLLCSGCTYYEIPGYFQRGLDGSSALGLRNLREVIETFLKLIFEIKVQKRTLFNKRPQRVY
jgi:glycosyltransferase involved in cell wall biosynthesis